MLRNTIYYSLKPYIPKWWRRKVRRRIALRLRKRSKDIWPIMPGSERAPEGWLGWPAGKKFAVILTHDVEGVAGLNKCRSLMNLEVDLGFRSSFNFIPEGSYRVDATLRHELEQKGFEVGVHDLHHDGRLFRSLRRFRRRALRINRYLRDWNAVGFRAGFMLHNLDWLHHLDIKYDLSTFDTDPFEPQPDGRHTIFPFWVSPSTIQGADDIQTSLVNSAETYNGYVELPYTLPQDSTLFLLLCERTTNIWKRKVDWIAEHGGMVLLDTHPDYMEFGGTVRGGGRYAADMYAELLEYIRSKYSGEYWHALPREVADYVSGRPVTNYEMSPLSAPTYQPSELAAAGNNESNSVAGLKQEASARTPEVRPHKSDKSLRLRGKHAAVLLFSYFPDDPRPRRAAEALLAEGVSVEVICLQKDKSEPRHEIVGGVDVFRIPIRRQRGGKLKYLTQYSAFILRSFLRLAARSLSQRYDFVHVHNMPDVLVFSALVPKALGAKIILDLHDPMPELMQTIFELSESSFGVRLLKYLEKLSIGFADLAVTVNLACSRIFSSRSCSPNKIAVVMNSPDEKIFEFHVPTSNGLTGKNSPSPFSILYHGSLVPRNGFDLAVDALEIAQKRIPDVRLMVCGERNSYLEEVMESAQKRGLEESVHYLGLKDREEIVEAINRCNLGIVPNHRNTFTQINTPTRIFEYLSLGKPVVAPRTLGIEDYFGKDDLLFFDAGDSTDLARQIEFAYFNRGELARIVERGQQVYLANSWDHQRASLLHSISDLL